MKQGERNEKGYSEKAAERGEPSYVWRDGQKRRLALIQKYAGERIHGIILENGCGLGAYLSRLTPDSGFAVGLEIEFERAKSAKQAAVSEKSDLVNSCGEFLPFKDNSFDMILSNEVIEHVNNDFFCIQEMVRCLKPGGRILLFCPNRGYPFETHGIYRKGKYYFGNKLFVNYLPRKLRDKLAPHVNVYTKHDLAERFTGLNVRFIEQTVIFGGYDNIIARSGGFGRFLRSFLQGLEKTPLRALGLSHFWVIEKENKS